LREVQVVAGSKRVATEIYGGLEVNLHALLNSALNGEEAALPARKGITQGEEIMNNHQSANITKR
jgi:hypothetical protein